MNTMTVGARVTVNGNPHCTIAEVLTGQLTGMVEVHMHRPDGRRVMTICVDATDVERHRCMSPNPKSGGRCLLLEGHPEKHVSDYADLQRY